MSFHLTSYKLLAFDIYATLIDWETGIYEALIHLLLKLPSNNENHPLRNSAAETRRYLLTSYTNLEHQIQKENPTWPYPKILATVWERLANQVGVEFEEKESAEFGMTIGTWPAFDDTIEAMKILGKYYKLVVLSNVDKPSFHRTLTGPLAGVKFDAIYTAEDIGSYKPDPRNFQYLVENAEKDFGVKKEEILMVAQSLGFDHIPVKKAGFRPSVWIKRREDQSIMGKKFEDVKDKVKLGAVFDTLCDFAEEVEKVFGDKK